MSQPFLKSIGLTHPAHQRANASAASAITTVLPISSSNASTVSLGPAADGPDLEQLYMLTGPDGASPLGGSNIGAKAGKRLNSLGEDVALAFGSAKRSYDAWVDKLQAVTRKSTASKGELQKMVDAQKAFMAQIDKHLDQAKASAEFVEGLTALKAKVSDIEKMVQGVDLAVIAVQAALKGKDVRTAERKKELAKKTLDERESEVKEQQETIKSALALAVKFALVETWVEIIPEALGFIDEQLFAQLPKAELAELKEKCEEATAALHDTQDDLDALAIQAAQKQLDQANTILSNGYEIIVAAAESLGMTQQRVIKMLQNSPATLDASRMLDASRVMLKLMTSARKAGEAYLVEGDAVLAACVQDVPYYGGFIGLVEQSKTVDPSHARALVKTAKSNVETLKIWAEYLRSVQSEVKDGIADCYDLSDQGYMKNYNRIKPLMLKMLSGG